ncbi:PDDEXK-like family protein [Natronobacterium texcoconense]|uniref:PDDEXK-like family protein n=1 Tax=Natronobacterium texcoconense TaxID=1095778 RepID=UPI00147E3E21|nr:PD-(D/E)XK nuclease family protein [Natronobacterium texcoconense]
MAEQDTAEWISTLTKRLDEIEENRYTLLEILGKSEDERSWQSMLTYFLNPNKPHGFDETVLQAFTKAIETHPETDASDLNVDSDGVKVETEVPTPPRGSADILIYAQNEWFICIEMKVDSGETGDQTERYYHSPRLGSLVKARHSARGGESEYVYLAPESASAPYKHEFVHVSWRDVVPHIEDCLSSNSGDPRSEIQLADFIRNIKKHLTMKDFDAISEEAQLYADHKSKLEDARDEFREERDRLKTNIKSGLRKAFEEESWKTRKSGKSSTWIQLYKKGWHNEDFNIEYEPHVLLDDQPAKIGLYVDIERGDKSIKSDVKDYIYEHADEAELKRLGWTMTGDVKPCLEKHLSLDMESPADTIDEAIQSLKALDAEIGVEIDDAVRMYSSE